MAVLRWPKQQPQNLEELYGWLSEMVDQLENRLTVVRGVTIGTSETTVAHGKPHRPTAMWAEARTNVAVWKSSQPDERAGYFTAASSVVCDVYVYL